MAEVPIIPIEEGTVNIGMDVLETADELYDENIIRLEF